MIDLPKESLHNAFLPRLWAAQKIGHELDVIRMSGKAADPEVVASIVKLAKKHGIVTPYTSFLVTEEGTDLRQAEMIGRRRFNILASNAAGSGFGGGTRAATEAQDDSMVFARMKSVAAVRGASIGSADAAVMAPAGMLDGLEKKARDENAAKGFASVATRTIGGKTFYLRGGVWIDADAEAPEAASMKTTTIAARSAEYFDLMTKDPAIARYLALGSDLKVVHRGVVYVIASK